MFDDGGSQTASVPAKIGPLAAAQKKVSPGPGIQGKLM